MRFSHGKKVLAVLALCLVFPIQTYAYFIKNGGDDSLDGTTDATAWASLSKASSLPSGSDVYLKCGSAWTNQRLIVNWSGTSSDRVIIGAYYGSGTIGVSGDKPVIDGQQTFPGVESTPLIDVAGADYVTLTDIAVKNSSSWNVCFSGGALYGIADNLDLVWSWKSNLRFKDGSDYGVIKNCVVTQNGNAFAADSNNTWGAAIAIVGSDYVEVRNNRVFENFGEGINFHTGSDYGIAEKNLIYGNRAAQMYIDGASHCTFRYNLIYGSSDTTYWRGYTDTSYPGTGIYIADETWDGDQATDGNTIYGNFIANCYRGFHIGNNVDADKQLFYNNSVIACYRGIHISTANIYTGCEIKNNIVWLTGNGNDLVSAPGSSTGLTFAYNLWSDSVSGLAAGDGDVIGAPGIKKTSGWDTISSGSLSASDFDLQPGSIAVNAGYPLGQSYAETIDAIQSIPPDTFVFLNQDGQGSKWEIGADVYLETTGPATGSSTSKILMNIGSISAARIALYPYPLATHPNTAIFLVKEE